MADLKITQLTADTTPTTDDLLVTVNDPAGTPGNRKSTVGQVLIAGNMPNGMVVQVASALTTANATGTTTIPLDNTIPQNTEGDQYMTVSITPKSTTNVLVIQIVALASHSVNTANIAMALFQDSTANALAATNAYQPTATGPLTLCLNHTMTAGTTSSTAFNVRLGGTGAGTLTFNSGSGIGADLFGATTKSSIIVWEYKA